MAVELAAAYISLIPSLDGARGQIEKQLGGVDTGKAGAKVGAGFSSKIGSVLKVGAVATGAAVAGVLGTSLVKGFGRLKAIDEAEGKLRGLGYSAQTVEAVMGDALESVKGTAFGLDEAATAAAGAMASGIKPGAELERNLKLVADAATIAGTDMGSMGAIFNKVAASNKVQMDVINQLHDAGVPALSLLATEMGVTAEEASKMASAGEIDFATFQAAMETGLGGAALESGNTFTGAMKNVGAALGRLGAAFLGPAFEHGTTIFGGLTAAIDKLGPVADRVGKVVGGALGSAVEGLGPLFKNIGSVVGPVFESLGSTFKTLGPQLMQIVQGFSPLSLIFQAIQPLMPTIMSAFQTLGETFMKIIPPIVQIARTLSDALVPIITQIISTVMPPLMRVFQAIAPVFAQVVQAIAPLVDILASILMPVIEALLPIVETVFNAVASIIEAVMTIVSGIIQTVTSLIKGDWAGVWEGIKTIFKGVWDAIKAILVGAWNIIKSVFTGALNVIKSLWNSVWNGIKTLFGNVWKSIVSAATGFFKSVKTKFTNVMDFIKGIPDKIMGFFSGIGKWLKDSGKALIDGFLDGIKGAFEGAKKFVEDGLGGIRDLFPFSPAKEGPFAGKGWVAYSGQSVGETFASSLVAALHDGKKDVRDELTGIQSEFDDMTGPSAAFSVRSAVPALAGGGAGGLPGAITLLDADGSILANTRVIAGNAVTTASAAGRRSLRSGGIDRRQW